MSGGRLCALSLAGMVLLRIVWHVSVHAETSGLAAGMAALLLPLLPYCAALAFRLRGPWIYGGIAAWVYFCHGAMEAFATPDERLWALAEAALAMLYFGGLWLRTRAAKMARVAATAEAD